MGRYQYCLWEQMGTLLTDLPAARQIQREGMTLAKQQLTAAHHSFETSARTVTSGVGLRKHTWLRTSSFPQDTRVFFEDLPFDGEGLLHSTMNSAI